MGVFHGTEDAVRTYVEQLNSTLENIDDDLADNLPAYGCEDYSYEPIAVLSTVAEVVQRRESLRGAVVSRATESTPTLVRDDAHWLYQGWHGFLQTRRLRVWHEADGSLVAAVTERPGDTGTSITNAAEAVLAQLQAEYPGQALTVIEHYAPRPTGAGAEASDETWTLTSMDTDGVTTLELPPLPEVQPATYDLVSLAPGGYARWESLGAAAVLARLGSDLNDAPGATSAH